MKQCPLVNVGHQIRKVVKANGIRTVSVTMRTFDAMRKLKSIGKTQDYMLNRLIWTGASKDDAQKIAHATGLKISRDAEGQWQ